jgi:tetratricopeptide (TPR) repeat protein
MMGEHASLDALRKLVAGSLAEPDLGCTLAHLRLCQACWEKASRLAPKATLLLESLCDGKPTAEPVPASSYRDLLSRTAAVLQGQASALQAEKEDARRDLRLLLEMPPELRLEALDQEHLLVSRSLVEALLAEVRQLWPTKVALAEELTHLALEVVERLSDCEIQDATRFDLLAHCWAYNANCRRVQTDFRSTEQAFQASQFYLERGSGDPLLRAEIADLRASFRRLQARFPEALELLGEAVTAYAEIGDRHRVGRALFKKTAIYGEMGQPERALQLLERVIPLLDVHQEPRFRWIVENYRIALLNLAGHNEEAWAALPRARQLVAQVGMAVDHFRLRYLKGIIACDLGRLVEAEAALAEARDGFIEHGLGYDAAEVSMRLAVLLLRQGRTAETKQLAAESLPIFQSRDIHREALAALMIFRQAAAVETATVTLAEEVSRYLSKARHNPALPYQPSA